MESYYEHSSISQSQLKSLLISPKAFTNEREAELYFEEKTHFIIGSAVDCMLTQSMEIYNQTYHVSNLNSKPSDTIKSIINMVFDNAVQHYGSRLGNINSEDYKELIIDACDNHAYQSRWSEQTRINKICENYEYWEDLKASQGKIVLSQEEFNLINTIVMSLRTNEATSVYFNAPEIHYQVPIYFEYMDVGCKALLDMVIFDRKAKTIQPIDIKTMGDYTITFPKSLRRRRYDIQAAFYTEALKYLYPDYTILPFKFIVESTTDPGQPLVFTCDETLLDIGKNGRECIYLKGDVLDTLYPDNKKTVYYQKLEDIKGFVQLLELYKYYSTNGFEVDQVVRENKSELQIDWSGIIV